MIVFFEVPRIATCFLHEIDCICEVFWITKGNDVPNQDLVLVKRNQNGNSRKTTMFIFGNHVGFKLLCEQFFTILFGTNDTFDVGARNRDLFVVKKFNTRPLCAIEIHILDASTKYNSFKLHMGMPLLETYHTWKFLVAKNRDCNP